jgi:predicted TIM-barrel fold metal-dependent hydrolase
MTAFIDTHAHLDFQRLRSVDASLQAMIATMDAMKIEKTILMPVPEGGAARQLTYDLPELLPALQKYPGRILLMAGPGALGEMYFQKPANAVTAADRQVFTEKAKALAATPIVGFGEIGIVHLSLPQMGRRHAYEAAPADHPLLLILTDIAAANGLPIDVHFDLIPADMDLPQRLVNPGAQYPNPARLLRNQEEFERFLGHNRSTKIVWAHVGGEPINTRTPEVVRRMLAQNPNLYMSFRVAKTTPDPADALTPTGKLKPDWARLIVEFPERFVLGSDSFYQDGDDLRGGSVRGLDNFQLLLAQLPRDVAQKIARENIPRIYRLGAVATSSKPAR